jgi:hypothetical protein
MGRNGLNVMVLRTLKTRFGTYVSENFQFSETYLKEHFRFFEKQILKMTFPSPCFSVFRFNSFKQTFVVINLFSNFPFF